MREMLTAAGFAGDDVPFVRGSSARKRFTTKAIDALREALDAHVIERALAEPEHLPAGVGDDLLRCLGATALERTGTREIFAIDDVVRAGVDDAPPFHGRWKLGSQSGLHTGELAARLAVATGIPTAVRSAQQMLANAGELEGYGSGRWFFGHRLPPRGVH